MSLTMILIVGVAIVIVHKTGSLSKAFGFLFKWAFYPVLCTFAIGALVGALIGRNALPLGVIIGFITGIVLAIRDANKKLKGN